MLIPSAITLLPINTFINFPSIFSDELKTLSSIYFAFSILSSSNVSYLSISLVSSPDILKKVHG